MATRFIFEPPRRPKANAGPTMKSLLVRCPATSKLTNTGQTVEEKSWPVTKVKTQKLACTHCGQVHSWNKKDVILARPLQ